MPVTDLHADVAAPPQADRLDVVATVVDAVADGCLTATDIAEAIGMTNRQGSYYPHAAAELGYLEEVADTSPVEWQLTERGAALVALDAPGRVDDLTEAVLAVGYITRYVDDGLAALIGDLNERGYSEHTAARRAQTIAAWASFAFDTDRGLQVAAIARSVRHTRDRAPEVGRRAAAARAARVNQTVRRGELCQRCFIEMPVSGVCANC